MSLNDSVVQGIADFDILHRTIHGLPNEAVNTSGGPIPTLSNVISGLFGRVMSSLSATSTSGLNVDTQDNKTFVIQKGKAFQPGTPVVAYGGNNKIIAGIVVSYTDTQLSVKPTLAIGEGSSNAWTIGFSGPVGLPGVKGDEGPPGKDATIGTGTGSPVETLYTKMPWEV